MLPTMPGTGEPVSGSEETSGDDRGRMDHRAGRYEVIACR